MLTHAFYKALLFLGAGSVIHAMDDEQDIKKMGALARFMPITAVRLPHRLVLDRRRAAVLGLLVEGRRARSTPGPSAPALWAIGALTAVLTAYYMGREYFLVFRGEQRWVEAERRTAHGAARHGAGYDPHDPRWVMTVPLVVLAALLGRSVGFIDLPFHPHLDFLERWLAPGRRREPARSTDWSIGRLWAFAVVDGALAVVGVRAGDRALADASSTARRSSRAFFVHGLVHRLGVRPLHRPAVDRGRRRASSTVVDTKVIDGAVNGVAALVRDVGRAAPQGSDRLRAQLRARPRRRRRASLVAYLLVRAEG